MRLHYLSPMQFGRRLNRFCRRLSGSSALSHCMFLEAVLYQARTAIPWRDLSGECGDWNVVYHCFRRREKRGTWAGLWRWISKRGNAEIKEIFINSTILRTHRYTTCADEWTSAAFVLTSLGEIHDAKGFELAWVQLPGDPGPEAAVIDTACDNNAIGWPAGLAA